ncbi:MAG TPA: peptide ABC transporter substrate-binding protein [Erysipelotrichaceae bacterium]|nr:peptide ABC transporter substrate-binding protein [Erysipelotrichaceae bacterium]
MKKLLVALFVAAIALTGCAKKEVVYRNDYNYVYTADIEQLDYTVTYQSSNHEHIANFVDGLMEHDTLGNLVGALAESYTVNADATEFVFKLRKGVKWVTVEGEEYAEVTAEDWVTGLQHGADFNTETGYILEGVIKNYAEYTSGEVTDFSQVGVEAVDDYTLKFTLVESTPYFHTMTTYGVLFPVNKEFLLSRGTGCELGNPDPANCDFGTTEGDTILYNGAYLLAVNTPKSEIRYTANPTYWDKKNVFIENVKLTFYDGSDPDSLFRNFDDGNLSAAPVYTDNEATYAIAKEKYGDSIFIGRLTTVTYYISFNYDRQAYANFNDATKVVSTKTDKQKADTKLAILNENFRTAIFRGIDRAAINAQGVGEELKFNALRNTYTSPQFVSTSDGKSYGELVSAALTEIDSELFPAGFDLSDSQDPYFDADIAAAKMALAKTELEAAGVTFPVVIDVVGYGPSQKNMNTRLAYKTMLESTFPGLVQVNINVAETADDYYNSFYYNNEASQTNYDINVGSGWGPDYGDPKTYVATFSPNNGDLLKGLGFEAGADTNVAAKTAAGFFEFEELNVAAESEIADLDLRYALYAKAEAYLIGHALMLPNVSQGGVFQVSRIKPYTQSWADYGISDYKFKFRQVTDHVITLEERAEAKEAWEKARAK